MVEKRLFYIFDFETKKKIKIFLLLPKIARTYIFKGISIKPGVQTQFLPNTPLSYSVTLKKKKNIWIN